MVRFNFKKVAASVAALSIVACMAAVPTSASDSAIELKIGKIEVPVSEAKAGTVIDVPVRINAPDLTGFMFVFTVESSADGGALSREVVFNNAKIESTVLNEPKTNDAFGGTWATANPTSLDSVNTDDEGYGDFMTIHVTLNQDLALGDKYMITYEAAGPSGLENIWSNDEISTHYDVDSDDGWIEVVDDTPQTTTTEAPATTTTTEAPATTTTEAPADTTTVPAGTTTAATTADAGNASNTSASTAAGAGGTGTTTVASSTGSPQTGSSDVLPIAGAAAAVAVLGGVALVAKKKND